MIDPVTRFWLTILFVIPVTVWRKVHRMSDAVTDTILMRKRK